MSVTLRKSRKFTFEYTETVDGKEKVEASFNFEFPFSEDKEYSSIAAELKKKLIPDATTDEDKEKNDVAVRLLATQARDRELRSCLKSCVGVDMEIDIEGGETEVVPCVITLEDGTIDEDAQKVAFEFIKSQNGMMAKIICAQAGLSIKNL
jgi:hypothetical protein